jgi:hypothetical protein
MATRGFEFAYMLDGSNATPVVRDFILGAAAAHKVGDLMLIQSDGYADQVTTTTTEVSVVCAEAIAAADVTAGTTAVKCWVITRNQVWRCSTDATTATTALIGYVKQWDTVDANTIDADDINSGAMIVAQGSPDDGNPYPSELDDDGNVIGYVVFSDTTFGNA